MNAQLIVMLTHHDQTVKNACKLFAACRDLPVQFWGFKNVGLPKPQMAELIAMMKEADKKTFLEVVTYSETECMDGAQLAVDLGFDYLMGTLFYPAVWKFLRQKPDITYLPFVGKVSGSPSILEGPIEDIIGEAVKCASMGIKGFDLLAYRYLDDSEELARQFTAAAPGTTVIAGSIGSRERLQFVEDIGAWAFTMGSALFEERFVSGGDFRVNLIKVLETMADIEAKGRGQK
jgi:hypothetical protein